MFGGTRIEVLISRAHSQSFVVSAVGSALSTHKAHPNDPLRSFAAASPRARAAWGLHPSNGKAFLGFSELEHHQQHRIIAQHRWIYMRGS